MFYSGPSAPAVPVPGPGRGGRGQARGGDRGRGRALGQRPGEGLRAAARVIVHESLDDPDPGNLPLPFTPRRVAGINFD